MNRFCRYLMAVAMLLSGIVAGAFVRGNTMDNGDYTHSAYMPDGTLKSRQFCTKTVRTVIKVTADGDTIVKTYPYNKVVTRSYIGQFEKSPEGLVYHTPAGVYDFSKQRHCWYLRDRLGSTAAVVDGDGNLLQTTAYYPSGTPHQLPTMAIATPVDAATDRLHIGNRWLSHSGLNWYDNTARMHDPLLMRFAVPDPLWADYPALSPWSHCAGNPLNLIDPSGQDLIITGELAKKALEQLQQATPGITLSMEDGNVSYKVVNEQKVNAGSKKIMEAIDNKKITTNIQTTNAECLKDGAPFVCGAYMGNTYIKVGNEEYVSAKQVINPSVIEKAEAYSIAPGMLTLHEVTEAYEGGLIALEEGASSPREGAEGSTYERAHDRATPQSVNIYEEFFDKNGDIIKNEEDKEKATKAKWFIMPLGWRIDIQKYN